MSDTITRVAAVDIGTNTVRLLIADVDPAGHVTWVDRRANVTRLGQGVDAIGALGVAAITRTTEILAGYRTAIGEADVDATAAIATSAVRDAVNRDVFLDAALETLGSRPEVVSGDVEAALTFQGTTAMAQGAGPFLVIDPGGGSTEFVIGRDSPSFVASVDIGSVRLTERALPHHPVPPEELAHARRIVRELLATHVVLPETPSRVFGVAGTYTSLAAMHLGLDTYDSASVHGTELAAAQLHDLTDRLATMTVAEISAIPSMDGKRAPVITGGAVVAEQALAHTRCGAIVVSERDSLDGLAVRIARSLQH